ncbi:hypothetical protein Pelo_15491 [Pelomyxa schiedti]|nr:hypothetical protein Pelo_15491 [Pelomyxa schiedti]
MCECSGTIRALEQRVARLESVLSGTILDLLGNSQPDLSAFGEYRRNKHSETEAACGCVGVDAGAVVSGGGGPGRPDGDYGSSVCLAKLQHFSPSSELIAGGKVLQNIVLVGRQFQKANFRGCDVSGICMCACTLRNSVFSQIVARSALLCGTDFSSSNFSRSVLRDCDLRGCSLVGCDLSNAELTNVDLTGADLSGANMTGATLVHTKLGECKLIDVNLSGASISDIDLSKTIVNGLKLANAELNNVTWKSSGESCPISRVNADGAKIMGLEFSRIQLDQTCSFVGSHFSSVNFISCSCGGCRFDQSKFLEDCYITESSFQGANFSGCDITSLFLNCEADEIDLSESVVANTDFSGSILTNGAFTGTEMTSCTLNGCTLNESIYKIGILVTDVTLTFDCFHCEVFSEVATSSVRKKLIWKRILEEYSHCFSPGAPCSTESKINHIKVSCLALTSKLKVRFSGESSSSPQFSCSAIPISYSTNNDSSSQSECECTTTTSSAPTTRTQNLLKLVCWLRALHVIVLPRLEGFSGHLDLLFDLFWGLPLSQQFTGRRLLSNFGFEGMLEKMTTSPYSSQYGFTWYFKKFAKEFQDPMFNHEKNTFLQYLSCCPMSNELIPLAWPHIIPTSPLLNLKTVKLMAKNLPAPKIMEEAVNLLSASISKSESSPSPKELWEILNSISHWEDALETFSCLQVLLEACNELIPELIFTSIQKVNETLAAYLVTTYASRLEVLQAIQATALAGWKGLPFVVKLLVKCKSLSTRDITDTNSCNHRNFKIHGASKENPMLYSCALGYCCKNTQAMKWLFKHMNFEKSAAINALAMCCTYHKRKSAIWIVEKFEVTSKELYEWGYCSHYFTASNVWREWLGALCPSTLPDFPATLIITLRGASGEQGSCQMQDDSANSVLTVKEPLLPEEGDTVTGVIRATHPIIIVVGGAGGHQQSFNSREGDCFLSRAVAPDAPKLPMCCGGKKDTPACFGGGGPGYFRTECIKEGTGGRSLYKKFHIGSGGGATIFMDGHKILACAAGGRGGGTSQLRGAGGGTAHPSIEQSSFIEESGFIPGTCEIVSERKKVTVPAGRCGYAAITCPTTGRTLLEFTSHGSYAVFFKRM